MGYEDFVWFIMSEEDKGSDMALDYWFKCCDLDGDGCLRANEMLVSSCIQKFVICFGTLTKPQLHNSCMYQQYTNVCCQCAKTYESCSLHYATWTPLRQGKHQHAVDTTELGVAAAVLLFRAAAQDGVLVPGACSL